MNRMSIIAVLTTGLIFGCGGPERRKPVEKTRFLMDTLVRISIYDQDKSERRIEERIDRAFGVIASLENLTSDYIDSSRVSILSRSSGKGSTVTDPHVYRILEQTLAISTRTDGAFDPTIGPVKILWAFDSDHPAVPDSADIRSLLPQVGYKKIILSGGRVALDRPGMRLDLGGIAKGYIIDRAVAFLRKEGIATGLVDAGGDMRIFGTHPFRHSWKIGIRHPRKGYTDLFGVLEADSGSIATSGDYERFFEVDGRRYHHILDPRNGYPADKCVSVTVTTETAALADGYATAAFVMGPEQGIRFLGHQDGVEGLILYLKEDRLRYVMTDGLKERIQITKNLE